MNVLPVLYMAPLEPTPESERAPHASVMPAEVLEHLAPREGGVYVDATLGAGGHTEAILEIPGTRVIGVDRDEKALEIARARLARFGDRVTFVHGRFSELERHLDELGVAEVDGLVADLGLSSMQLADPERGMSFRGEGPLDMRMDPSEGETVLELIERLGDDELADVIYQYGEERRSRRVARCIKQAFAQGELRTTLDLRRAVVRAVGPARIGGVDPATRTFQGLRIAVNRELDEIEALLSAAKGRVREGGVIAIISFHSLEDRIVKRVTRERSVWQPLTKKPLVATEEETADNPRARSAKLRPARRVAPDAVWPRLSPRYERRDRGEGEEGGS